MTNFDRHAFRILDGIRGVAAFAVVLYHFRESLGLPFFKAGYLAVDLFFCLSGFVVSYAYQQRLGTDLTFPQFARLRMIRLWPLIVLGTMLSAIVIVAGQLFSHHAVVDSYWIAALGLNLLILPMLVGSDHRMFWANPPEWSLFFELAVNFVYGFVARRLSVRSIVLLLVIAYPVLAIGIFRSGTANIGWERTQFLYGVARVTYSFFAGVLIFRNIGKLTIFARLQRPRIVLLLTAITFTLPVSGLLRPFFDSLFVLAGSPLLVCWGASAGQGGAMRRTASFLGAVSYPIYALHSAAALAAETFASRYPEHRVAITLAALIVLVPVSIAAGTYYDIPVRRRLSGYFGVGRPSGVP